ncbi:hypothetical protein DL95DRAFT_316565, partial [Leptodontidium sp. 2 PMI_412]
RFKTNGHPVRSAIHKQEIGRLVVGWVTTSEYLLLYVFFFDSFFPAVWWRFPPFVGLFTGMRGLARLPMRQSSNLPWRVPTPS